MKNLLFLFAIVVIAFACTPHLSADSTPAGTTMTKAQLIAEGEKMADAQLAVFAGKPPVIDWVGGVFWAGLADFSHLSTKTDYADAIAKMGDDVQWTPLYHPKTPVHADDLCICQTFLDDYATRNDPAHLAKSKERLDVVCATIDKEDPTKIPVTNVKGLVWWWCDALFMAPAGHARLSVLTKDPKYLAAMDKEWWRTADLLYDKDEHLFYRDASFLDKRTKNGQKIFWTRGNGWVFGGLARTLRFIPADSPIRPKYVTIFKEMAAKLASLQQPNGTWTPSLLDSVEYPSPETSGTALDCFAFAWGINNGILDRATYLPVAEKAFAALLAARRADGLLGYVQQIGAAPGSVKPDDTQLYGVGAFLMSVCELSKLAPIDLPPAPTLVPSPVDSSAPTK